MLLASQAVFYNVIFGLLEGWLTFNWKGGSLSIGKVAHFHLGKLAHFRKEIPRMEKFCAMLGFSKEMTESLIVKKEALKCSGKIYSEQHRRNFDIKDDILRVENDPDDESRLNLTINRKPIADWFREQWHRLRYGARVPQQEERKSRGFKL